MKGVENVVTYEEALDVKKEVECLGMKKTYERKDYIEKVETKRFLYCSKSVQSEHETQMFNKGWKVVSSGFATINTAPKGGFKYVKMLESCYFKNINEDELC